MCLPVERFRVTSRKSTHFLLASIVIFRPCSLKIAHRSFLVNSSYQAGDPLMIPRPSSRNNPKLLQNSTELSNYVWDLKDNNVDFNIKWKILKQAKPKVLIVLRRVAFRVGYWKENFV